MAVPIINLLHMLDSYRKSDAVLIVCQNNAKEAVEIAAINEEAAKVLGLGSEELVGKPLDTILSARIASAITDYIEYNDDRNDLQAVLSKVRDFAVKIAGGRELSFKLRIIRGEAIDRNPWFHLVLVDEEKLQQANKLRESIKESFKGQEVPDERTGLPNRRSILKDLELVAHHVQDGQISASFAVIDINRYENLLREYGPEVCNSLHRHIAHICKLKLRTEDTIGTLSERSLGVILIDAGQESARMVLNRLRWAIGSSPVELVKKGDLVAQVNIGFTPLDGAITETEVLEKCEAFMVEQRKQVGNTIHLVVTHDRRKLPPVERRKANIPVTIDRRRKDRRKR